MELDPLTGKYTRFQVNRVKNSPERVASVSINVSNDSDNSDDENNVYTVTDRTHLNSESDAKYAKSFRQLTREALPRLDNYRNIMSLQAANRPTLDELHNATLPNKKDATVVYISNIT
ncbi:Amino acid permease N-terminal [Popillia japonica]